jgi:hypothetical protein
VPLNEELLARLERCLSDQRVPWLSARRQPLSDDEMDQLTAPVGIELPPELRCGGVGSTVHPDHNALS